MQEIRVLHITAHLGGGVGRVLSKVAQLRKMQNSNVNETFVCLELPEKMQFVNALRDSGIEVIVSPDADQINRLIEMADIIQLEWWHHPYLAGWLCKQKSIRARLVVWSHISGLHYPTIPKDFVMQPHAFIFTSAASMKSFWKMPDLVDSEQRQGDNIIKVIPSSGGFDDIPLVYRKDYQKLLRFGYLGSLNFAKLHPNIMSYLEAVNMSGFAVDFYGDIAANERFAGMVNDISSGVKVRLCGYTESPAEALRNMDVFVYLLNPDHYGTTENALLEAMASGAVPIVMDNPVESSIVRHGETGLIIDNPKSFAEAVAFLNNNPEELKRLSDTAADDTRARFSIEKTEQELSYCYDELMHSDKRDFNLREIFGSTPAEWFQSCLGEYRKYFEKGSDDYAVSSSRSQHPVLYEKTKSSIFHFRRYYPEDVIIRSWAEMLERDIANTSIG